MAMHRRVYAWMHGWMHGLSTTGEAEEPFEEQKMHRETIRTGLHNDEQQKSTDFWKVGWHRMSHWHDVCSPLRFC